jgi:cytochrome c oxidase cbb3-type subunit III
MSDHTPERDELTGVQTTGHEWDGLKELNNPAPRWWLWVLLITIVWAIGYMIFYPAIVKPRGETSGRLGYTSYDELKASQAEIDSRRGAMMDKIQAASLQQIDTDPQLRQFAIAGGAAAFKENCAACHGTGAEGLAGYPNLNDDDWLWGGTLDAIHQTLVFGIRSGHESARVSAMPNFGADELLTTQQISDVVDYVLSLPTGKITTARQQRGETVFAEQCVSCHGLGGIGNREMGGPALNDAIWLYGNDRDSITAQVVRARQGVMPNWAERLPEATVKSLAVYVHSLGGGE